MAYPKMERKAHKHCELRKEVLQDDAFRADDGLANILAVALIVVAFGLSYVQWFFFVPWLVRKWRGRTADLAN